MLINHAAYLPSGGKHSFDRPVPDTQIHTRGVGLGPLYRAPVCYRHPGGIIGDPASHPPVFPYTISMYRNSVGKNYKKMRQQEYPIQNVIGMQEVMRII